MSGRTSSHAIQAVLMGAVLVVLLAHSCSATSLTNAEPTASPLYGMWWDAKLNISTIDPSTGATGPTVYSGQLALVWPLTPAVDHQGKRMFTLTNGFLTAGGVLTIFDTSHPNNLRVTRQIVFPGDYFWGVQYDSVSDRVWVVSAFIAGPPPLKVKQPFLVCIDLAQGTARNVTNLPAGELPSSLDIGGGPLVLDEKNRVLVIPTMKNPNQPTENFSLTKFDIDKEQYLDSIPLPQLYPAALATDWQSGTVYGLFSSVGKDDGLSFGMLNPVDGSIKVMNHWKDNKLKFVMGSLAVIDASVGHFYSVIGVAQFDPAALVTVSTTTGAVLSANYFRSQQPQGLFVL